MKYQFDELFQNLKNHEYKFSISARLFGKWKIMGQRIIITIYRNKSCNNGPKVTNQSTIKLSSFNSVYQNHIKDLIWIHKRKTILSVVIGYCTDDLSFDIYARRWIFCRQDIMTIKSYDDLRSFCFPEKCILIKSYNLCHFLMCQYFVIFVAHCRWRLSHVWSSLQIHLRQCNETKSTLVCSW